jgi:hypothetical protein
MQMRLHRQYGYGLRNIAGAMEGLRGQSPDPDSDPSSYGQGGDEAINVNEFEIEPYHWKSLPLGIVAGLQYNTETFGKCFYAMVDTVNFYDFFVADLELLVTEMNFYNLVVYDPIRFSSNVAALYE